MLGRTFCLAFVTFNKTADNCNACTTFAVLHSLLTLFIDFLDRLIWFFVIYCLLCQEQELLGSKIGSFTKGCEWENNGEGARNCDLNRTSDDTLVNIY